jgi:hypothetical protein
MMAADPVMAQWRGGRRWPVEIAAASRAAGDGVGSSPLGVRDDDGEAVVTVDHPTGDVDHDPVLEPVDDPIVDHPIVDHHDDGSGDTGRLVLLW